jgi:hypothetical protein
MVKRSATHISAMRKERLFNNAELTRIKIKKRTSSKNKIPYPKLGAPKKLKSGCGCKGRKQRARTVIPNKGRDAFGSFQVSVLSDCLKTQAIPRSAKRKLRAIEMPSVSTQTPT